jgi:hypothetical protein
MKRIPDAVDLHTILWVKDILHTTDIQHAIELVLRAVAQAEKQHDNHYLKHVKDNIHKIKINREDER